MNDLDGEKVAREYTLQQRWISYGLIFVALAALLYFSVRFAQIAWTFSSSWVRVPLFVLSGLWMFLAARWIVILLRRKSKTGTFLNSFTEAEAKRAEYRSKLGAGKPLGPQAWFWSIPLAVSTVFLVFGVLAIVGAFVLGRSSWHLFAPFLALAAFCLALPFVVLFKAIRRKLKSGSFLPSEEDLEEARANCAKPKKLWHRIMLASMNLLLAVGWTDMAIGRNHNRASAWFCAAIWWLVAAIWTVQVFRPSARQCALPAQPSEPQTSPEA